MSEDILLRTIFWPHPTPVFRFHAIIVRIFISIRGHLQRRSAKTKIFIYPSPVWPGMFFLTKWLWNTHTHAHKNTAALNDIYHFCGSVWQVVKMDFYIVPFALCPPQVWFCFRDIPSDLFWRSGKLFHMLSNPFSSVSPPTPTSGSVPK